MNAGRSSILAPIMLLFMLLSVLLAGCAARQPRCDGRLRPINVTPGAAAAGHRAVIHP
jgi:hypothetical protein